MLEACLFGLLLADSAAIVAALYWGGLIIGGGLLLVSVLGGGDHHGADVDAGSGFDLDHAHGDVDVSADVDLDAAAAAHLGHADVDFAHGVHGGMAALTTWFSLRFLIFFIAMFGAVGVILHHLSPLGTWTTFVAAVAGGLIVGQGVHHLFRYIRQTSGNSTPRPQDYVHKLARVTIRITPPDKGEVALLVRGGERYVPATADSPARDFPAGDEVVVVSYRGGVAQVISREEFEQRAQVRQGEAT